MTAEILLSRLAKVRKTGADSWSACCPAHADKAPSLAIRETPEGVVLLHCFAGCAVETVLDAVGLSFDELYPEKLDHHGRPLARPFHAADVLRLIGKESLIVAATAKTLAKRPLSEREQKRVMDSAVLIQGALAAARIEVRWA
jgi:DNA primase